MKLAIYGIGGYYRENKERLLSTMESLDEISFFVDSKACEEEVFEGKPLCPPAHAVKFDFDLMLIMSVEHFSSMRNQVKMLGICEEKIYPFGKFVAEKNHGKMRLYKKSNVWPTGKRVLIIVPELDYHGAPIAALFLESVLSSKGYDVCIAAPRGNPLFVSEMVRKGATVLILPSLPYIGNEELYWIRMYDVVIVNTFPMVLAALRISVCKPVFWWIHEGSEKHTNIYKNTLEIFSNDMNGQWTKGNIKVCAVSEIAKRNFVACYPGMNIDIMPYGIPDSGKISTCINLSGKIVFAVIGNVYPLKGQKLFLQAIREMKKEYRLQAEFWLIGNMGANEYCDEIRRLADGIPEMRIMGVLTRSEIALAYSKIHIVVCPSLEDALPVVVTEGMMHGKVCLVSNAVGQAKILTDGENGLVCQVGDPHSLSNKMVWVLTHKDLLEDIGNKSRKIYEDYFSIEKFWKSVEGKILDVEKRFTS